MPRRTARFAQVVLEQLPQRDTRAAPATMKSLAEVADSLRSFVVNELLEVKHAMNRFPTPVPNVSSRTSLAPTDENARSLLSKMRAIMQEERFRSGKLR